MNRVGVFLLLTVLAGCGTKEIVPGKEVTQRQRDSAVAASRLPGAQGVGRAIRVQDSAAARAARLDSIDP